MAESVFESLDYIYAPSSNVAADVADLEKSVGARIVFAIDDEGTRVAMVELATGPPHLVLAGHLVGAHSLLVYRVADLNAAIVVLQSNGLQMDRKIELPMGPAGTFTVGGGRRFAIYQRTRGDEISNFEGRRDF